MLKYAHEKGCPWDGRTCRFAAGGGHLDVLEYAHENRCSWGERTCAEAALGGHLAVLKYARDKRCPWDKKQCIRLAKEQGHAHVVAWIRGNPQGEGTTAAPAAVGDAIEPRARLVPSSLAAKPPPRATKRKIPFWVWRQRKRR